MMIDLFNFRSSGIPLTATYFLIWLIMERSTNPSTKYTTPDFLIPKRPQDMTLWYKLVWMQCTLSLVVYHLRFRYWWPVATSFEYLDTGLWIVDRVAKHTQAEICMHSGFVRISTVSEVPLSLQLFGHIAYFQTTPTLKSVSIIILSKSM